MTQSCRDLNLFGVSCFPGVVSGAAEEPAGDEAEAEGGRAEQTLVDDRHDPQPQQRQDEERRQPVALRNDADE